MIYYRNSKVTNVIYLTENVQFVISFYAHGRWSVTVVVEKLDFFIAIFQDYEQIISELITFNIVKIFFSHSVKAFTILFKLLFLFRTITALNISA